MLFFLHIEEFLHDEMGSCYTSNHILHLKLSNADFLGKHEGWDVGLNLLEEKKNILQFVHP